MRHPTGTIVAVRPLLDGPRLRIVATVQLDTGESVEAHLPDRETAAILPRSVLLKTGSRAPRSLLETVRSIVVRMCQDRHARVWTYKDRRFFSFQSWKSVRFVEDEELAAERSRGLSPAEEAPAATAG